MFKYEMMFIVKATMESEKVSSTAENVKNIISTNKANLTEYKELGEKKLAYPIKKEITGYYFLTNFEASKEAIKEIDRKLSLDENILRHLIIKLDEE